MLSRSARLSPAVLLFSLCALAQPPIPALGPALPPAQPMRFSESSLTIHTTAVPNRPFTVAGKGGAILGMQDGTAELWQFPYKVFSGMHLRVELDGYPVPIDLNSNAATLDVSPGHTTLTYSHAAITVRQHMFVPAAEEQSANSGAHGGVIVFEVESPLAATLTVQLSPAMVAQWPAPHWGQATWDWQPMGDAGAWKLNTDDPSLFGLIAIPGAKPGAFVPYQEHPRTLPLEFRLRYDPKVTRTAFYPMMCELSRAGERNNRAGIAALEDRVVQDLRELSTVWQTTDAYYQHFFDTRLITQTPDREFDRALAWSELAIETSQATTRDGETGLVAGWYPSFDSARPGFGWYFGRDTLWSQYAINSYGDAALARRSMDFLIRRQRADGKMMHEFSQSASLLYGDMAWDKLEYEYAAADATPLYLLAMLDYVRATGDTAYLKQHWDSVKLAYQFESTHDSDGDGVYDNREGTGWVEGWPPVSPHQELYLAALDRDATSAMALLARWMNDDTLAASADGRAVKVSKAVDAYRQPDGRFAFSRNLDGTYDTTRTVYPSVALWSRTNGLREDDAMLQMWSSHLFSTDWGARAVAEDDRIYDPMSYHQGAVWPLFTGWSAMAKYRAGNALSAYADLRQNTALTWVQDPGAVTELLSGRFYQPLGRSSTHQLWSSAMVMAPAVRGLFGLEPDAMHHALVVHPHLPAEWDTASLQHVRVGDVLYRITMRRKGETLSVQAESDTATVLCLRAQEEVRDTDTNCREAATPVHTLQAPLPAVELSLITRRATEFGDSTTQPKVLQQTSTANGTRLQMEAPQGSTVRFHLRRNRAKLAVSAEGGTLDKDADDVVVAFPSAAGDAPQYVTQTLQLRW